MSNEYKVFGCPKCGDSWSTKEWRVSTTLDVCGVEDVDMAGDPSTEEGRDPNYFYICPGCNYSINGHLLVDMEGKLEEVEEEELEEHRVTIALNVCVPEGSSREYILATVLRIIEETDTNILEDIFDDIAIEGIDF